MNLTQVKKYVFNNEKTKIVITSPFGSRSDPITGRASYHYGIDYAPTTPGKSMALYPITDGVVVSVGKDNSAGNYIYIKYPKLGFVSFYCHLKKKPLVKKNAKVTSTTKVGYTGTTGYSTGVHLHLGIRMINNYSKNSFSGYVNPAKVAIKTTRTTTDLLNMRAKPSLKGKVITTIPKDKKVTEVIRKYKTASGYVWDKVKYNGKTGYCASIYLK